MLLTIMSRALIGKAVLSCTPRVCLMRIPMLTLSVTASTSSSAATTMIPHVFIDIILWNAVLIHVHWFLIIVIIADTILIAIIVLIVILISVRTSKLWFSCIGLRQNFSTHGWSDLRLKGSYWLSWHLTLVILAVLRIISILWLLLMRHMSLYRSCVYIMLLTLLLLLC